MKLFAWEVEPPENDPKVARVVLNKVRLERVRQFGNCFVGLELWKRLGLDRFYEQLLDGETADVAWSRVLVVLAINRLCAPGSESSIEERWYPDTALDDLLRIEEGKLNDTRLYRCLDLRMRRLNPSYLSLDHVAIFQPLFGNSLLEFLDSR